MKRYHQEENPSKPILSEAKKHPCGHCGKRFMYESDRREHENTHLGIRDHKCKCGKGYSSRKALLQHQKLAHEEAKNQEMLSCNVSKIYFCASIVFSALSHLGEDHETSVCLALSYLSMIFLFGAREGLAILMLQCVEKTGLAKIDLCSCAHRVRDKQLSLVHERILESNIYRISPNKKKDPHN